MLEKIHDSVLWKSAAPAEVRLFIWEQHFLVEPSITPQPTPIEFLGNHIFFMSQHTLIPNDTF